MLLNYDEDVEAMCDGDAMILATPEAIAVPMLRESERFQCPQMSETEVGYVLRPRSDPSLHRGLKALGEPLAQGRLRCVLIASPETHDVTTEDLHYWADDVRKEVYNAVFVQVVTASGARPCGDKPGCLHCPNAPQRLLGEFVEETSARHASLREALRELMPALSERDLCIFQDWAGDASPKDPGKPITDAELGKRYNGICARQVQNIRRKIRASTPKLYAKAEAIRNKRVRITRAYSAGD